MKPTKLNQKLTLNKTTITKLSNAETEVIKGGYPCCSMAMTGCTARIPCYPDTFMC